MPFWMNATASSPAAPSPSPGLEPLCCKADREKAVAPLPWCLTITFALCAPTRSSNSCPRRWKSCGLLSSTFVHVDPADEGTPICQHGTNATWNEFRSNPDVVFVDHSGSGVVSPPSASSSTEGHITAEAIVWSHTGGGYPHRTNS